MTLVERTLLLVVARVLLKFISIHHGGWVQEQQQLRVAIKAAIES